MINVKMGSKNKSTPLLFQSKLLCFSLFYLFTTLFLALYNSLSPTKCLFRSSPFDPVQSPLFSYPSSYGEHKYAIPTHHSSCSSPTFFSDYMTVLKEIKSLCKTSSSGLRYMQGKADSFGGNFTTQKRLSYFNHQKNNSNVKIPCGFFKEFPVRSSDRRAMEKCDGVVVVSAIFNNHDKIRQPRGLGSQTLSSVCFFMFIDDVTTKDLEHHGLISRESQEHKKKIGAWRVVEVFTQKLYGNPAMNGVIPKYLVHRLFPNSKYSIWVDAKLQLVVDPLLLIHSLVVVEDMDMAISRHPYYVHTMEEAMATARWKKWWDVDALKQQMETYCEHGLQPWSQRKLPYPSDVPDSALILRKHSMSTNLFSCLMFNELEAFNPRDQLAFAYVRDLMSPKPKLNMFHVEVFEQVAIEYRHNLLKPPGAGAGWTGTHHNDNDIIMTKRATTDLSSFNQSFWGRCHNYLMQMWSEAETESESQSQSSSSSSHR